MLLADMMTFDGEVKAIGRYGVSGKKASVLARANFEETKKHIISASIEGVKDPLRGHVENIIMNQVIPVGTGAFRLVGRFPGEPRPEEKEEEETKGIEEIKEMEKMVPKKPEKKKSVKTKKRISKPPKKPVKKPVQKKKPKKSAKPKAKPAKKPKKTEKKPKKAGKKKK